MKHRAMTTNFDELVLPDVANRDISTPITIHAREGSESIPPFSMISSSSPSAAMVPILLGISSFIVSFVLLTLTYAPGIHPGTSSNSPEMKVDPITCRISTPNDNGCWDGRVKWTYPKCTAGTGQTVLGNTIPPGSSTCYKTIYMNLEWTTVWLGLWTFGWFYGLCRIIENSFCNIWRRSLRLSMLITFITNIFGMWYSFNAVFHYLNDHEGNFFRSQMFFTILEYGTMFIISLHFNKHVYHPILLKVTQGSAMFQIFQLVLDEGQQFLSTNQQHSGRNIFLLLGDLTTFLVVTRIVMTNQCKVRTSQQRFNDISNKWQLIWKISKFGVVCFMLELFVFHMFFSDNATVTLFPIWMGAA